MNRELVFKQYELRVVKEDDDLVFVQLRTTEPGTAPRLVFDACSHCDTPRMAHVAIDLRSGDMVLLEVRP